MTRLRAVAWRPLAVTWRTAWAEALADRRSFVSQMAVMVVNDLAWIFFWQVFFHRVGTLRGWTLDDMMVLYAVLAASVGLVFGGLANLRWLGHLVATGGIDTALALPVHPLGFLAVRQVSPVSVGDIAFGLGLFAAVGHPTPGRLALFTVASLAAAAITAGFMVMLGSLAFVAGRHPTDELGLNALLMFASYPIDIYGGTVRLALYGLVPAALVGSVPARLVQAPSVGGAAVVGAGTVAFLAAGALSFRLGLRRYTSGATWTGV